jgi:hypothetical protein
MTAATMTPDARKILTNIRNHGPAIASDMGSLFAPRPADGAPQTAKREWTEAMIRAHQALSELEENNRIIRVLSRRHVLFMTAEDAGRLVTETQKAIDYVVSTTN